MEAEIIVTVQVGASKAGVPDKIINPFKKSGSAIYLDKSTTPRLCKGSESLNFNVSFFFFFNSTHS